MHIFKSFRYLKISRLYSTHCKLDLQSSDTIYHTPVMVNETLEHLNLAPGDTVVDMTFGAGGHSKKILDNIPGVKIFALDRDNVAIKFAEELSEKYPDQVIPLKGRFSELVDLLKIHKIKPNSIDGIIFDFGVSSMQFNTPERGFMLSKDGPLDMRMDGCKNSDNPTVAEVLDKIEERDLYHIIKYYGEEKKARKIARAIVEARYSFRSLRTTYELAKFIESLFPNNVNLDKLGRYQHCATKTFQALRIFVNNELNEINYGLIIAEKLLKKHGRMVTIAFHSLEDTIVKRHIFGNVSGGIANKLPLKYINYGKVWDNHEEVESLTQSSWKMLHKHVLTASEEEINVNPRSRSAKFRGLIKIL